MILINYKDLIHKPEINAFQYGYYMCKSLGLCQTEAKLSLIILNEKNNSFIHKHKYFLLIGI